MPTYTCCKCGYAVVSKNIATRSALPVADSSRMGSLLLQCIEATSLVRIADDPQRPVGQKYYPELSSREQAVRTEVGRDVEIRITVRDDETPAEALVVWLDLVAELPADKRGHMICKSFGGHDYVPDGPPTC